MRVRCESRRALVMGENGVSFCGCLEWMMMGFVGFTLGLRYKGRLRQSVIG